MYVNDKQIEQATEHKYLGNIVRSVLTDKQNISSPNYTYRTSVTELTEPYH